MHKYPIFPPILYLIKDFVPRNTLVPEKTHTTIQKTDFPPFKYFPVPCVGKNKKTNIFGILGNRFSFDSGQRCMLIMHPRTQGLIVLFYTDVGHSTLVYSTKISRPGVNTVHLRKHRLADRKINFSRIADNKYN